MGGVILHSPMASGLLIYASKYSNPSWYDCFVNIKKVPYIRAPIFLIHGTKDNYIPIRNSE